MSGNGVPFAAAAAAAVAASSPGATDGSSGSTEPADSGVAAAYGHLQQAPAARRWSHPQVQELAPHIDHNITTAQSH